MKPFRLITSLLLEDERLIKTIQFKKPQYLGEPINAVKIFSSKGVDELLVLDKTQNGINFDLLEQIFGEAFMPVTYGGSIRTMADVEMTKLVLESPGLDASTQNLDATSTRPRRPPRRGLDGRRGLDA